MKHAGTSIALGLLAVLALSNGQATSTCTITKADIVFVLDASKSVNNKQWKQELTFAKEVVKGFDIGPNKVRVALVEFSGGATVQAGFNKHANLTSLLSGIDKVGGRKTNLGTRTGLALDLVRTTLLPQKRPNVPLTVIVITDGGSTGSRPDNLRAFAALKATKATVFAVGVGEYRKTELNLIASNLKLVYTYTDFNKLLQLQQIFRNKACKVVNKLAPAATQRTTRRTKPTTTPKPTPRITDHPSARIPVPLTMCKDLMDCTIFGADVCTDYKEFSWKNCKATCFLCPPPSTTPGVCADKRDCSGFGKSSCVNPDFRKFMLAHCRKFCDLCNAKN